MSNMRIWDQNKTIDPQYTKQAKVSGMNITTFSLQSVVMMATEQWGPFGRGWGYEVKSERFDEGSTIQEAFTHTDEHGRVIEKAEVKEITHTLLVSFWYMDDGEKIECPIQAGHTPYLMATKYGTKHDGEYYKKTLADAIKKSLSMLGFAADIFLGLMDDQHYQQVMEEQRQIQAESQRPKLIEEFGVKVRHMAENFKGNTMPHSLKAQLDAAIGEVNRECRKLNLSPDKFIKKLNEAFEARVEELKKQGDKK